jgi:hypothetical protein
MADTTFIVYTQEHVIKEVMEFNPNLFWMKLGDSDGRFARKPTCTAALIPNFTPS